MWTITNQQAAWWCNALQLPSENMLWNPSIVYTGYTALPCCLAAKFETKTLGTKTCHQRTPSFQFPDQLTAMDVQGQISVHLVVWQLNCLHGKVSSTPLDHYHSGHERRKNHHTTLAICMDQHLRIYRIGANNIIMRSCSLCGYFLKV